ncbi:MAG: ADP-ribosylation factor-like protein [Promethearchaeota archaeon]
MLFQKIFLFGIDKSGKTTLSQALRTGKYEGDIFPTTYFDVQALFLRHFEQSIEFKLWDAPGQISYRRVWGEGYEAANLMIFVLDTADKKRFSEAKDALEGVLNEEETKGIPLIFLYHKIDIDEAKANYYEAQNLFKPALYPDRDVYQLHTTVKDKRTLDDVKEVIAKIVKKSRETPITVQ